MLDASNTPSELRIPTRWVGPIALHSSLYSGNVMVPMSTFESPLWPSVNRGARLSRACTDGIHAILRRDCMTRSVAVAAPDAKTMQHIMTQVSAQKTTLASVVESTSQHLSFLDCEMDQVGHLGYFRLVINSQNASGHNMVTKAADAMLNWLLSSFEALQYVSISGNLCADKKNAAVNGLRGRGKEVIAEMLIPEHLCQTILHTSPEKIVSLHTRKNLLGSILAGSVRSANAHFANMLLAVYLATGQDAANIVEGSQGITHAEVMHGDLYFSVTLPNIIVGTVGNGKGCAMIQSNLARMGCEGHQAQSAQKLALIIAAAVLCGELSLLAAQTRPGELMHAHLSLERSQQRTHAQSAQTKRNEHDT